MVLPFLALLFLVPSFTSPPSSSASPAGATDTADTPASGIGDTGSLQARRLTAAPGAPPSPPTPPTPAPATPPQCGGVPALDKAEVRALAEGAAAALDEPLTVAVTDRAGRVLALYRKGTGPALDDRAVGLARTGAFFSNDQAPLSSRTVRFVSGIHFPPGISFTPNAALYGIENTNRGCNLQVPFAPGQAVPPARSLNGLPCDALDDRGCGTGPVTGKVQPLDADPTAVDPGGLPIFRGGRLLGGIGVTGPVPAGPGAAGPGSRDRFEFAALAAFGNVPAGPAGGLTPFPDPLPPPAVVFIDGVRLPFVEQVTRPARTVPGVAHGAFVLGPADGGCVPEGDLVAPRDSPLGAASLSRAEVERILSQAVAAAQRTRALIRLPIGERTRMVIAVADTEGETLGLVRMPDATVFSIDVAVAKARNVAWFSSPAGKVDLPGLPADTAVTNRTISFTSQPLFPPGIDGTPEGPFFRGLFETDLANPCTQGSDPRNVLRNGVVYFPGSIPLYRNGVLVGGLGVSGDGVEQDDFVSLHGAEGFLPPEDLWADQVLLDGVRLPFLKLPRNPED